MKLLFQLLSIKNNILKKKKKNYNYTFHRVTNVVIENQLFFYFLSYAKAVIQSRVNE